MRDPLEYLCSSKEDHCKRAPAVHVNWSTGNVEAVKFLTNIGIWSTLYFEDQSTKRSKPLIVFHLIFYRRLLQRLC